MGEAERCYFYARGGIEAALFRVSFSDRAPEKQQELFPYAGGMNHFWTDSEEMTCHVAILDESGKLDLNMAKDEMLERLLTTLGVPQEEKSALMEAVEMRKKPRSASETAGGSTQPAKPFGSVEELLQIKKVSRETVYGTHRRDESGKVVSKRGLIDFLTVYTGTTGININYAEPEALASLPGMDLSSANSIVQARQDHAFGNADMAARTSGTLPGEALSFVSTRLSGSYCLVSTAWVKGSQVRRSVRLIAKLNSASKLGHQRLAWCDEYWPSPQILKWMNFRSQEVPAQEARFSPSFNYQEIS